MGWKISKPLGNKGSSILTGAGTGALMGSRFGPWGALIGAGAGGLMGGLTAGGKVKGNPWSTDQVGSALVDLNDTSKFDFLKTGPELTDKATLASSLYKPGAGKAEGAFGEWMNKLGAPSSVDQVRSEIDGQKMQALLEQIDQDSKTSAGQVRTAALDSGWGGAGMGSDIESVGLGRVAGDAMKAKEEARLGYATSELDRQAAKEKALAEAMGLRYTTTAAGDTQDKSIAASLASSDANSLNSLLSTESTLKNARDLSLADILAGKSKAQVDALVSLFNAGIPKAANPNEDPMSMMLGNMAGGFGASFGTKMGDS